MDNMLNKLSIKKGRVTSLRRLVGLARALRFELMWTARHPEIEIALPGYRGSFIVRRFSSDMNVFNSVFCEGELESFLPEAPRFIIDGGANVGYTAAFYAQRFPDATIIAVEPSRSNLAMLRRNCSGYENVVILEGALWPDSTTVRIVNPGDESWSFQVEASDDSGGVRAYTIEEIMDSYGIEAIDLIKLDIEGAERQLFESRSDRWLPRVKAIVVEIHGEGARAAIERACTPDDFDETRSGEKAVLVRRPLAKVDGKAH